MHFRVGQAVIDADDDRGRARGEGDAAVVVDIEAAADPAAAVNVDHDGRLLRKAGRREHAQLHILAVAAGDDQILHAHPLGLGVAADVLALRLAGGGFLLFGALRDDLVQVQIVLVAGICLRCHVLASWNNDNL